ncbi:hypothetical protein [Priestia flexa]|uniref:hypothetical protein n=1 Tax=Priestia flexa TaxID=86664 RepID=UPI00099CE18C|nr:hypothetical protein [Priestia flexa]AQX56628.1 hypothetical protein BC359_20695 [Priestia flexa]
MKELRRLILVITALMSFVIGTSLSYALLTQKTYLINDSIFSGYISGIGSFLGGVVGGLVAFGVARSQFIQDKDKEKQKQNKIYKNILRALLNELNHNKTILEILVSNPKDKQLYLTSLENEVWQKVKFDANNFLPTEIYPLLDDHIREYRDIQSGILPEYNNVDEIDFNVRLIALSKLIRDIEKVEGVLI